MTKLRFTLIIFLTLFGASLTSFAQSITSIEPNVFQAGELTGIVDILGEGNSWGEGAGVYYARLVNDVDTIYHVDLTVIDNNHIQAEYVIQGSVSTGCYLVETYDLVNEWVGLDCGVTIEGEGEDSSILSISPNSGMQGQTINAEVEGFNTFWFVGAGIYWVRLIDPNGDLIFTTLTSFNSDTNVEITFELPMDAELGCYDVIAYDETVGEVALVCGFEVTGEVDVDEINNQQEIAYYPNPTSGHLNIDLDEQQDITIVSLQGEIVWSGILNKSSEINLSSFSRGVYVIKDSKGNSYRFTKI
ncbi:MAG: T9SS type A sorting domain-containing protein [Bacteroidota bacterium]